MGWGGGSRDAKRKAWMAAFAAITGWRAGTYASHTAQVVVPVA
jgi:hypothetical protein